MATPKTSQQPAKDARYFDSGRVVEKLGKKAARSSSVNMLSQLARFAINLVSISVLGRLLIREDYGLVGMSAAWTAFANVIGNLGISAAVLQRPNITRAQLSWLWATVVGMGVAMTLVTLGIAPLLSSFFREPEVRWITSVQGLAFAIVAAGSIHIALMQRMMEFGRLAILGIAAQSIGLGIGIALAYMGYGAWALVFMGLATSTLRTGMGWFACPWRPSFREKAEEFGQLLKFGWYVMLTGLTNYLSRNLDNILIGRFFGSGELGLYRRAYSLLEYPTTRLLPAFRKVGDTALSRIQDDPPRFFRAATAMLHLYMLVGTPFIVVLTMGALPFIRVLMGTQWEPAAPIFAALAPLMWVRLSSSVGTMCFFASGQVKEMSRWNLVNCVFSVTAILIGIPWGPIGVAVSYSVTGILLRVPYLFYRLRCIEGFRPIELLKIQLVYGVLAFASGMAAYGAIYLMRPTSDIVEFLVVSLSALVTFAMLALVVPMVRKEALALWKRMRQAFQK